MIGDPSRLESDDVGDASQRYTAHTASWRTVAGADTPEEFYASWLDLQCRLIKGVTDGVVVLGRPEKGRFAPAASWPPGQRVPSQVVEAAERSLAERKQLIVKAASPRSSAGQHRYQLAHPLQVADRLCGVVAVGLKEHNENELQQVMGQLSHGCAWLEDRTHDHGASLDESPHFDVLFQNLNFAA